MECSGESSQNRFALIFLLALACGLASLSATATDLRASRDCILASLYNARKDLVGNELYLRLKQVCARPISRDALARFQVRWESIDAHAHRQDWNRLRRSQSGQSSPLQKTLSEIDQGRMGPSRTISNRQSRVLRDETVSRATRNWLDADRALSKWVDDRSELTLERIQELNRIINRGMKLDHPEPAGELRRAGTDLIALNQESRRYVDGALVKQAMGDFIEWYRSNEGKVHPILLAAQAYQRIVSIHPFSDGNGRTSRMVMDWILQKHGYPPASMAGDWSTTAVALYGRLSDQENVAPEFVVNAVTDGVERTQMLLERALAEN